MTAILRSEFGVPEDWQQGYALAQLLWEKGVGKHSRSKEREDASREAKQAADYARSVAVLRKRQQE